MLAKQDRWQEDLFAACPLSRLILDDHVLKRFDGVLDLSWPREEIRELYSETQGRPSIDVHHPVRPGRRPRCIRGLPQLAAVSWALGWAM